MKSEESRGERRGRAKTKEKRGKKVSGGELKESQNPSVAQELARQLATVSWSNEGLCMHAVN